MTNFKGKILSLRTSEVTELLCLSKTHFSRLVRAKVLPAQVNGRYDAVKTNHAYLRYREEQAAQARAIGPELKLIVTRERKVAAELEALARKNAIAAGEVAPIARLEEVLAEAVTIARGHLLSLPSALAPRLAVTSDPRQIENILEEEITDALEALAALNVGDEPPGGDGEGSRAA
jgi:hypothetical protein